MNPSLEALREIEAELLAESVKKRRGYLPGKLAGLSSRIKAAREALEAQFLSGPQIMEKYVPGYERKPTNCPRCGSPVDLPKFEALP